MDVKVLERVDSVQLCFHWVVIIEVLGVVSDPVLARVVVISVVRVEGKPELDAVLPVGNKMVYWDQVFKAAMQEIL